MSHLDEGQLHELLDGELDEPARAAALAHLASCELCKAAYAEALSFFTEAESLVEAVQVPDIRVLSVEPAVAAAAAPAPRRDVREIASATRLRRYRTLAWAASLVLAVGLGWYGSSLSRTESPAVVSETAASAKPATDAVSPQPSQAAPVQTPAPAPAVVTPPADKRRANEEKTTALQGSGAEGALAAASNQAPAAPAAKATQSAEAVSQDLARDAAPAEPAPAPPALAATEAEDRKKERDEVAPVRAMRAPSGLEAAAGARRAGYTKVDMDEAVRILGGSIRLIDGLSPTGVLSNRGWPGTTQVRVVYEDPPGRELWLDQSRMEAYSYADRATTLLPGDTTAVAGPGGRQSVRWMDQSGFTLSLTGFLPADSLRQLMRRVQ